MKRTEPPVEDIVLAAVAVAGLLRRFRLTRKEALRVLRSVGRKYVDTSPKHHQMMKSLHAKQRKENAANDAKRKKKILAKPEAERTPVEITILERLDEAEFMREILSKLE